MTLVLSLNSNWCLYFSLFVWSFTYWIKKLPLTTLKGSQISEHFLFFNWHLQASWLFLRSFFPSYLVKFRQLIMHATKAVFCFLIYLSTVVFFCLPCHCRQDFDQMICYYIKWMILALRDRKPLKTIEDHWRPCCKEQVVAQALFQLLWKHCFLYRFHYPHMIRCYCKKALGGVSIVSTYLWLGTPGLGKLRP